jgi:hypothetical protein
MNRLLPSVPPDITQIILSSVVSLSLSLPVNKIRLLACPVTPMSNASAHYRAARTFPPVLSSSTDWFKILGKDEMSNDALLQSRSIINTSKRCLGFN